MAEDTPQLRNLGATGPLLRLAGYLDLVAAVLWVVFAGAAFLIAPDGSTLRLVLALGVLFLVPGYLLIEAVAGIASSRRQRSMRAVIAIGVSPPIVGLLALATAIMPGGFTPLAIVVTIMLACVGLAILAMARRIGTARAATPRPAV